MRGIKAGTNNELAQESGKPWTAFPHVDKKQKERGCGLCRNPLILLAHQEGFEPPTFGFVVFLSSTTI